METDRNLSTDEEDPYADLFADFSAPSSGPPATAVTPSS